MTIKEYFKDWLPLIDTKELYKTLSKINRNNICPEYNNIFRAFNLCDYRNCKVICIGQDPYPQKGVATGIAFGNKSNVKELSPSLEVIKESVINFEIPHNLITFDQTLEDWEKQGVLMLNSSLTCEINKVGSHSMIWRPFIAKFLQNMTTTGIIYVLFGKQAQSFKPYINTKFNDVIEVQHPAYFARTNKTMPNVFKKINNLIYNKYKEKINWYYES